MGRLVWHKLGEKRFESGLDRGVLYLPDGTGVPWNGLTAVDEDTSDVESTAYYFDGIKYLDTRYPGDFSASLRAFTYPDEFLQFDGYDELANGVLLAHQPVYDRFGLSYRTLIGNDTDGTDHGYKLHILYNLVATPDTRSSKTLTGQTDLEEFSWKISGVPEAIPGHRPTVHIILDTTRLNPYLVRDIESMLYGIDDRLGAPPLPLLDGGLPPKPDVYEPVNGGTPSTAGAGSVDGGDVNGAELVSPDLIPGRPPTLPPLSELVDLLNSWVLIDIVDNGDGTWSATGPDEFVSMIDPTTFRITNDSIEMIDADTYQITTAHTF